MPLNDALDITSSPNLPQWLMAHSVSFAFTTYQTNRLFCVGINSEGNLALHERLFDKPMGLFAQDDRLYMSTRYQIWQLDNLLAPGETRNQSDRLYFPKQSHTTGDLNVHDVVLDQSGDLLFVNTDFSCLARLSPDYSFDPIWQPPFISNLVAEDRCHLNGLAMRDGQPAFMSACSMTDTASGWRNQRTNGGVVLDIQQNEVIATGLSMPHSPRWYREKLWLLNSGTGELGHIDLDRGQFIPLTFCPGFVRGLAFWEKFAFVGLSKLRSKTFTGLLLEERLAAEGKTPQCGLMIIDLDTGQVVHWLQLEGIVEELFDVVVLPRVRQPQSLGFQSDEIERWVTIKGQKGIVVTKPTVKRPSQGGMAPVAGVPREVWDDGASAGESNANQTANPITAPDLTALKFQQVFHLTPENLTDYDHFTFPSLQQRWQYLPQKGELYGVSATIQGEMVAFAIAEMHPDFTAELLSLFVSSAYRQQGIGRRLLTAIAKGVSKEGCTSLGLSYRSTPLTQIALEPLLKQLDWSTPVADHHLWRSVKLLNHLPSQPRPPQSQTSPKPLSQPPTSAQLKFDQGKTLTQAGDHRAAVACFQAAIALNPSFLAAYNQLGNACQALGQSDQAMATYQKLLKINPKVAQAHCNMGSLWQLKNKIEDAIAAYETAIQLKPDFAEPYLNLGRIYASQGRWSDAKTAFTTVIQMYPQDAEAYIELSMLLKLRGDIKRAIACLKTALQHQPNHVDVIHNLGCLWMIPGNFDQAQACFKRVIELQPDHPQVYGNLGQILCKIKNFPDAIACFDRALALNPEETNLYYQREHLRISVCDWEDYDQRMQVLQQKLQTYVDTENTAPILPLYINSFPMPLDLHQALAEKLAQSIVQSVQPLQKQCNFSSPAPPSPKIRIGYLSADFRKHAVGTLIYQIFQYHDRSRFEVFGYTLVDTADEFTESIQAGCDQFVNLAHLSPDAAAQKIHNDGIHILIDMAGYTSFSRPEILALQPAPIQIQYLGHPDTTGAAFIQYILADRWLIPEALATHYTEQVLEVPHALVASTLTIPQDICTREAFGLPIDGVVFCCFNRSDKFDPTVFETWMRILQRVPESVLWLIETSPAISLTLHQKAEKLGVSADRIVFTPSMPLDTYLAAYHCADLFLDTFVYNAGATGIHALQAGVPLLTCPGQTFAARMGASICAAAGLDSLICETISAYEEKAVHLATHRNELSAIQEQLQNQQAACPLFQPQQWVAEIETVLSQLYESVGLKH